MKLNKFLLLKIIILDQNYYKVKNAIINDHKKNGS